MSELKDLREEVSDMRVDQARTEEQVKILTSSVDGLRNDLNPLILSVAKGKGYIAAIALVSAALGAGIKEVLQSFFR